MKKMFIIFTVAATALSGCGVKKKTDNDNYQNPRYSVDSSDSIVNKMKFAVIEQGDTIAYKQLEKLYLKQKNFNFYVYSRVMADRYNYMPACINVYRSLMDRDTISNDLQLIALDYLKKAIEYGDTAAILELKNLKNK